MRPPEEWREVERLAVRLISTVALCFVQAPDEAFAGKLRRALAVLGGATLVERRAWAVRAIVQWAPEWQGAETDERRSWAVGELIRYLELTDKAFGGLNPTMLAQKLVNYSPNSARVKGAQGAERILAEVIYEDCNALGFDDSEDVDVDDIVGDLSRDVAKYQNSAK